LREEKEVNTQEFSEKKKKIQNRKGGVRVPRELFLGKVNPEGSQCSGIFHKKKVNNQEKIQNRKGGESLKGILFGKSALRRILKCEKLA